MVKAAIGVAVEVQSLQKFDIISVGFRELGQ